MKEIESHPDHFICLNAPAKADILWWQVFVADWDWMSMFWDSSKQLANIVVMSNALGS